MKCLFISTIAVCSSPAFSFSSSPFLPLKKQTPLSLFSCRKPGPTRRQGSRLYSTNNEELLKSILNDAAGDDDPYSKYTHQIAIPLQDSSELHSALHAIQTSLVRDCPRLIRACIMPALLRMPLLYVDGSSLENGNIGGSGSGNVDAILEEVIQKAIRDIVYREDSGRPSSATDSSAVGVVEPILLPFTGLELQGEDNSVLYCVGNNIKDDNREKKRKRTMFSEGDEDDGVYVVDDWSAATSPETKGQSGWEVLEELVHAIQHELETNYGLKTCWPLDKPQGEEINYDDSLVAAIKQKQKKWRPRVPFVRLPTNFYDGLEEERKRRTSENDDEDGNEENGTPFPIDMGFDGISPLFWYEAWGEEDIISPPGVRMRSVAVFRRMVPGGGESESSFYIRTSSDEGPKAWSSGAIEGGGGSMDLPGGDSKLAARERREDAKAMDRLGEVEQREERAWEEGKARWIEEIGAKDLNPTTDEESFAQFDVGMEVGAVRVEGEASYSTPWSERDSANFSNNEAHTTSEKPSSSVDEDQPDIDLSESTSSPDSFGTRRELPNIEDNPIFQRLWKGQSQVTPEGQNTASTLDGTPPSSPTPLPPYPSDPHFVGAWRIVTSPVGSKSVTIDDVESTSSDNFILRVDGQVMGGPVLDSKYQHKAAGGEWRMFQATQKSTGKDESTAPPATQTRLRIKLLVPPKKDRILRMEGEVTKGEGLLYCSGEAWTEDVEGGSNRKRLGPFSLMKLETIDRNSLIYTVDVSRPSPSGEEDGEG
ncbi:hypothetical protein ACHAWF_008916 [Thalassiosira exigua]